MEVKIPRLTETEWKFSPADGYTLEEVLYNGTDVTEEVTDYTYRADPVNEDGTEVKVVFTEKTSGTTGSDPSGSGSQQSGSDSSTSGGTSAKDSPKTGDDTPISLWMGAMTGIRGTGGLLSWFISEKEDTYALKDKKNTWKCAE